MGFTDNLINSVVIEKRSVLANTTGEEVESYTDTDTIAASVQDRTQSQMGGSLDVDGPVIVNAVVITDYAPGLPVKHLDVLRQVDVSPAIRYLVIKPKDPAGRHHHWEHQCQRIELLAGAGS